jgi:hypothetical protein
MYPKNYDMIYELSLIYNSVVLNIETLLQQKLCDYCRNVPDISYLDWMCLGFLEVCHTELYQTFSQYSAPQFSNRQWFMTEAKLNKIAYT